LKAMSERVCRALDPHLYPEKLHERALANPIVQKLWADTEWCETPVVG
jgi:hypothetical protein